MRCNELKVAASIGMCVAADARLQVVAERSCARVVVVVVVIDGTV
jgi:hypothetical protein